MWFPVDDAFHSHPKAQKAGDEALGLWTRAGAYCMAYLTDGFVPDWWVKQQPRGVIKARRLVSAQLWKRGENSGEQGWWFHDWKPENLKENVLLAREQARLRKAKSRAMSRVTDTVTDGVTHASVPSTTPLHSTPPHIPLVTSSGGVTSVDARGPRPHCPDHETNYEGGSCIPCMNRRKWDKANAGSLAADELEHKRLAKAAAAKALKDCRLCDEKGWVLGPDGTIADPSRHCTHNPESSSKEAVR